MKTPYNVVYLHSHDTGRYIQPYGYGLRTPNLQRFAETGVLFRQAFCASPTCSPSRAALMTGRAPHEVGMFGLAHHGWRLADYGATLTGVLGRAGYRTVLGGFQHIAPDATAHEDLGYDEYLPERKGLARAEVAEAFLRETPAEPFFLDVGFGETHRTPESADGGVWHNGQDSPAGDPRYVQPPPVLPDRPEIRLDFADYAVAVERLDRYYGLILDRLERSGLAERTIVLVTTDHGIAFPGMKCNLTDHGLGVLTMLRGPEDLGLRGGRVVDAVVSQTDLLPTLCDWLGLACPAGVTGRSWRPILDGTLDPAVPDALHDAVFGEVTYHGVAQVERSVRTPRFKYIQRYGAGFVRHSCDPGISRETAEGWGWMDRGLADEQLYDLLADPQEANNLADRPGFEREVTGLRTRLESWMQSTADPALSDEIPAQPARF